MALVNESSLLERMESAMPISVRPSSNSGIPGNGLDLTDHLTLYSSFMTFTLRAMVCCGAVPLRQRPHDQNLDTVADEIPITA